MLESPNYRTRAGAPLDAEHMVRLINLAGDGLPLHYWGHLAKPGEDPWQVGKQRARRAAGSFSWRNATFSEENGHVAALLMTYTIGVEPEVIDPANMPAIFVPLQELENQALNTLYLNVLATYPKYRGKGHGTKLLRHAEAIAGAKRLSLIVGDGNRAAMRLYQEFGFEAVAHRPAVAADGWSCKDNNYVLMLK